MRLFTWVTVAIVATTMMAVETVDAFNSNQILCKVNSERASRGLKPLGYSTLLGKAAQVQSNYQAQRRTMTHSNPNYAGVSGRYKSILGRAVWIAENVAYGYNNVDQVFRGWMNSPGHRANILNTKATHCQTAVAYGGSTPYYTQSFAQLGGSVSLPSCSGSYNTAPAPAYKTVTKVSPATTTTQCLATSRGRCVRWRKCTRSNGTVRCVIYRA